MFKIKEQIIYWSFLFFVFLLPISQFLSTKSLVIVAIISVFSNKKGNPSRFIENSWDLVLYLAVLIFGLSYSNDLTSGLKVLETVSSLLLVPFIIGRVSLSKRKIEVTMLVFLVGLLFSIIISLIYAGTNFSKSNDINSFFYYRLLELVNFQPTYFAYYLCFALTFCLYYLNSGYFNKFLFPLIVILMVLFSVLLLTEGRTAYVSMLFIFSFFILRLFFAQDKSKSQLVTFILVTIFMISILVINQFNHVGQEPINGDYWERIVLWKSAINANANYLFGVGTGDYKDVLNQYYKIQGLNQYADESLNSHNQFIQTFFSNGILGLIAVLGIIARPLYLSFKIQNTLGILIIFPFIIYGMTEVFLGRYQGVVFFALCHQIVISQYYYSRPNLVIKTS